MANCPETTVCTHAPLKCRYGYNARIDKLNLDIFEANIVNVDKTDFSTFD